uniref:Str_synth domain-containing protein n=1 Tax=Globodera pallida TaxID=36090 RepID=A0A183BR74_GLOPA
MASSSSNRPSHPSELLDAYHNNRTPNLQLADLGEHVVAFALDPQGSRHGPDGGLCDGKDDLFFTPTVHSDVNAS